MANEIRVEECRTNRSNGDWEIYPGKPLTVQTLDQSGTQQNTSALNDATEFVRVVNTHTAAVYVAVRDAGSFTLSSANGFYLKADGGEIDLSVSIAQGQIVSIINV